MEQKTEPARSSRAGAAIRFAASVLLLIVAAGVFFEVISAKREHRVPTFFGYSFSIVITGSMEPDIKVGEFLIVKETPLEEIGEGNDILFTAKSGTIAGERVVHRVIEVGTDADGLYFRTKGTNNAVADTEVVRADNFIGKAVAHSAFLGAVVSFFSNTYTIVAVMMLLSAPFIVKQIVKIIKLAKSGDQPSDDSSAGGDDA